LRNKENRYGERVTFPAEGNDRIPPKVGRQRQKEEKATRLATLPRLGLKVRRTNIRR